MKSLLKFANANGLKIARIRYKAQGKFVGYGYDLVKPTPAPSGTFEVIIRIEPTWYSHKKDRWSVAISNERGGTGLTWFKSLRELNTIDSEKLKRAFSFTMLRTNEPFLN